MFIRLPPFVLLVNFMKKRYNIELECENMRILVISDSHRRSSVVDKIIAAQPEARYVFFLGDNDIDVYGEAIEATFRRWYALTPKEPKAAKERQLWRLKKTWFEPWKKWRPPSARRTLALRSSETLRLPPPPKEVTFSAIAIGASSPLLETFTTLARGTYVERN
jgi:hypothetical protein